MNKTLGILSVLPVCFCALFFSCSDDDGGHFSPTYDLRPLTRVFRTFDTATQNPVSRKSRRVRPKHVIIGSEAETLPQLRNASIRDSVNAEETYTFTYGSKAHLYWTGAIGTDAHGVTVATATQALDDHGFPTRGLWYDAAGDFEYAYDYTYDKSLYLKTSQICYVDDPSENPDPRKDYEYESEWNEEGILKNRKGVEYDSNGIKEYEYKWRSTTLKNALRGTGGLGYDEYYRKYKEGLLTYQEETTFDRDGYPETLRIDNNGDGTFEENYYAKTSMTVEGYLESVTWIETDTDTNTWKETFAYDNEGLLKTTKDYDWVENQFVLDEISTDVWYKNPVNGPTGGINVYFESDEAGNPVGDYETVEWSETGLTRHYLISPGTEIYRITESLEKIMLLQ